MIREHDLVVMNGDMPEARISAGDVGTVVHVYPGGHAYEVEFTNLTGDTVAVVTVENAKVRPAASSDVHHSRPHAVA